MLTADDLKTETVPEQFSKLLLETYRNYGDSERHRSAFRYFATRILPAVNASHTKFDKRKFTDPLSEVFTYTDEAFGLLLVVNYEDRWISQHAAALGNPGATRRDILAKWVDARYTSATEGSRRGVSWTKEGLLKFNELSEMVKRQRAAVVGDEAENGVETDLTMWCRAQAGMTILSVNGGLTVDGATSSEVEEEDEVEAVGECDIIQL